MANNMDRMSLSSSSCCHHPRQAMLSQRQRRELSDGLSAYMPGCLRQWLSDMTLPDNACGTVSVRPHSSACRFPCLRTMLRHRYGRLHCGMGCCARNLLWHQGQAEGSIPRAGASSYGRRETRMVSPVLWP